MCLRERILRWIAQRPAVDYDRLQAMQDEYDRERQDEIDRVLREQRAERIRAERERAHQAAVARCAAEGHEEPRELDIIRWGSREPQRTLRTCPRCGQDVPAEVDA